MWDKCPARRRNTFTGKEGYPSLSFEVVCDHNRSIQSATLGFDGSTNDKTIVQFDGHVSNVRRNKTYTEREFDCFAIDGNGNVAIKKQKGLYLICDGGYQPKLVPTTITPMWVTFQEVRRSLH